MGITNATLLLSSMTVAIAVCLVFSTTATFSAALERSACGTLLAALLMPAERNPAPD